MTPRVDPGRLHVLTHEQGPYRRTHLELGRLAAAGGADVVQLREKEPRDTAALVRLAQALAQVVRAAGARLVVNDRVDVARAAAADGAHLGPRDLPPAEARRLLGPAALLGGTANDLATALALDRAPLDYLGVGPVFGTRSKARPAPALGLAGLARIARAVRLPVIAIGGIVVERVAEVLETGAHGVAVLSAVAGAADPEGETRRFREAIQAWLLVSR